jgi:hypothetical protein
MCTAFCSLRFGEPDRASEFFLTITFCARAEMLSRRALETPESCQMGESLFYRNDWWWTPHQQSGQLAAWASFLFPSQSRPKCGVAGGKRYGAAPRYLSS